MLSYHFRRIVHLLLPKSALKACSELLNLYWGWRRAGLREYVTLRRLRGSELSSFCSRTLRFPLFYRNNTTDVEVILGTIVREEYATPLLPSGAKIIVDAGVNIGDMFCWLLSQFADAMVIAIEPNPGTFAVLKMNLQPYGDRAVAINAALWSANCALRLDD